MDNATPITSAALMSPPQIKWRAVLLFVGLAILFSALWMQLARTLGLLAQEATTGMAAAVSQLGVLVAALLVMARQGRAAFRRVGWRRGPAGAYGLVLGATLAGVMLANNLSVQLGWMQVLSPAKPLQVLVSVLFIFLFSCMCAFAEEFGWRGFLLPALLPLGVRRALLLSGVLWFAWEAPLVLGGVLYPKMGAINLAGALVLHFFQVCGVAVLYGYLRLRFESVWLPAFAHAVLNTLGAASILLLTTNAPQWAGFGGPIGVVLVVVVAGGVYWRLPALLAGNPAHHANHNPSRRR